MVTVKEMIQTPRMVNLRAQNRSAERMRHDR